MSEDQDRIDRIIREALDRDEAEIYERLGDPSLLQMLGDVFRGRMRWISVLGTMIGLIFLLLAVYSALEFLRARELTAMIRWGAAMFFAVGTVLTMKIWYWMEMQRNALTRELKRLELQVAHLASRLERG